ncbi:MAG: FAD:protein FMN transferase [Bacteroidia bacterium]|nr:FAD:protein FMN transferase [Bacteroidia bacterium]
MRKLPLIFLVIVIMSCSREKINTRVSGAVFGTTYSIIYDSEKDFQKSFDSLFDVINRSLSTYLTDSDISRINRNEAVTVDEHFKKVLEASTIIFRNTKGAFDPTIGAVVNAWDFGPEGRIESLDSLKIARLMTSVGLDKVHISKEMVIKPSETYLDFNAIAKGYAVDVIGEFLEGEAIENYLVEIGGEILSRGINVEKLAAWKVGIDRPNFDGSQSIFSTLNLENAAMATSGTYRKFKTDSSGNRYAHIIDTETGYPAKSSILSVSVISETCMMADGYATALQAIEIEKIKDFLNIHPELKVMIIYEGDKNQFETLTFNDFPNK